MPSMVSFVVPFVVPFLCHLRCQSGIVAMASRRQNGAPAMPLVVSLVVDFVVSLGVSLPLLLLLRSHLVFVIGGLVPVVLLA